MNIEFQNFNNFVNQYLADRPDEITLEESVVAFRAYEAELKRFKKEIAPAIEELDQNGGSPLDIEQLKSQANAILQDEKTNR